jgi:pimeloyl-ACP methyl ester carboxylesterase
MTSRLLSLALVGLLAALAACAGNEPTVAPSLTIAPTPTLTPTIARTPTVAPGTTVAPTTTIAPVTADAIGDRVVCGETLRAGLSTVECEAISFDVSVPAICLEGSCGVIVDIPGGVENGEFAERHTRMQQLGGAAGYVVVQPSSPSGGWDYSTDSVRIRSFLDQLIGALDLDRKRVHIGGHSLGGFMAWVFVCDHADLIASAAPLGAGASTDGLVSCDFDAPGHPSQEVDIFLAHGRNDQIVPFSGALAQRDLVVTSWDMTETAVLASEPTYRWTRWTSARGTVFEFLEFDWTGGELGGHCYPGVTEEVGCGSDTPVHYGEAALDFYIAHPRGE